MLLLRTLPINNEQHGISTEQQSGVPPTAGSCFSGDGAAGGGQKLAPGLGPSPDTAAAAAAGGGQKLAPGLGPSPDTAAAAAAGGGQKLAPGLGPSPDTAAAAADPRPAAAVTDGARRDDASSSDGATAEQETDDASPPADDGASSASDSSEPCLSERLALTTRRSLQAAPDATPTESQWSCVTLSDLSAADGRSSDVSCASSAAPFQSSWSSESSQSFEVAELTSARSEPFESVCGQEEPAAETSRQRSELSDGACGQEEPAAETSQQRYDKLCRYFQTLDSVADRCPSAASRSCSPELSDNGPTAASQRSSPTNGLTAASQQSSPTNGLTAASQQSSPTNGLTAASQQSSPTNGLTAASQQSSPTNGLTAASQRSSPTPSDSPVSRLGATGSSLSSVHSAASGGGQSLTSLTSSVSFSDYAASISSKGEARTIGYAGFVGAAPSPASGRSDGYTRYAGSADFTCLRSSSPTRSKWGRAPRALRGTNRPRWSPAGGAGAVLMGDRCEPALTSFLQTSAPTPASVRSGRTGPIPTSRRQSAMPAPAAARLWGVPTREEQSLRAEASRRTLDAEPSSLAATWHQEFDEMMRPCRGDQPLLPHADRLRHRQPAPSPETLRQLRERVCLGCTRAFPDANYFDVYYHVNTVFRWFNWKLDT